MIRRLRLCAALALCLLAAVLPGCANMPKMLGGSGGDPTLILDGEQTHEVTLAKGRTLTLDMRDPAQSGYIFAGTVFDPALLRLDAIHSPSGGRVRYLFTAMAPGETYLQIKITKNEPGYRPDVFKRVRVTVQ